MLSHGHAEVKDSEYVVFVQLVAPVRRLFRRSLQSPGL